MKSLIAGVLLAISPCTIPAHQGLDGYRFGHKEYSLDSVTVNIKTYSSVNDLQEAAIIAGIKRPNKSVGEKVASFAVLSDDKKTCTIHVLDPSIIYRPEFIGHEFLHCVYGQWHTNNELKG